MTEERRSKNQRASSSLRSLIFAVIASVGFGSWVQSAAGAWFLFGLLGFLSEEVGYAIRWFTHWKDLKSAPWID